MLRFGFTRAQDWHRLTIAHLASVWLPTAVIVLRCAPPRTAVRTLGSIWKRLPPTRDGMHEKHRATQSHVLLSDACARRGTRGYQTTRCSVRQLICPRGMQQALL